MNVMCSKVEPLYMSEHHCKVVSCGSEPFKLLCCSQSAIVCCVQNTDNMSCSTPISKVVICSKAFQRFHKNNCRCHMICRILCIRKGLFCRCTLLFVTPGSCEENRSACSAIAHNTCRQHQLVPTYTADCSLLKPLLTGRCPEAIRPSDQNSHWLTKQQ